MQQTETETKTKREAHADINETSVLFRIRDEGFASSDALAEHFRARTGPRYDKLVKMTADLEKENLIKSERGSYRVKITAATIALMTDARTEDELVAVFRKQEAPNEKGVVRSMVRSALRARSTPIDQMHIPSPYLSSRPFMDKGTA